MSIKQEDLAGWIRKAGKRERVVELQYPYAGLNDVFVSIGYASKFILQQIREAAKEFYMNPRTRQQEERLNDEKLKKEYAAFIIKGWRGMTVERLRKLVPTLEVDAAVDPTTEVPYSQDVALSIMEVSMDFETWIIDSAQNVENFARVAEAKKEQYENLA